MSRPQRLAPGPVEGRAPGRGAGLPRLDVRGWLAYLAGRARAGARRVRGAMWPVFESALAAAFAWVLASDVLHRGSPIFAPIAAWVCLGFKPDRTPRKVAELGAGATVGVLIGDLASHVLAIGPIEIVVVLMVAALLGRFLDNGDLFTMQVGVNAVVILGFASSQLPGSGARDRWLDALAGAAVAFVVAVLLPRRPATRAGRYVRSTLHEFAILLEMLAAGLRRGDPQRFRELRGQRDALGKLVEETGETLRSAREVVTLNPTLWSFRPRLDELRREHRLARRALRTTDMIIRQAHGMTEEVGHGMAEISEPLTALAGGVHRIAGAAGADEPPLAARARLLGLAAQLAPGDVESDDWRPIALMSLLRALTVDLLQLSGLSKGEARAALADTGRRRRARPADPEHDPDDRASDLWGD